MRRRAGARPARLFVRAGELDRLREWATDADPVNTAGLAQLAERAQGRHGCRAGAQRRPGVRDAYEESLRALFGPGLCTVLMP